MTDRPDPPDSLLSHRAFARRWPWLVAIGAACLAASGAAAQSPGTAEIKAGESGGYARMIFNFETIPTVTTRMSNGILVISFSAPVDVSVDKLPASLGDYVAGARTDPDSRAVRLALSRRVTVNTMEAGNRLFVDLLPDGWKAQPPSLPQDIIDELNAKAKEVERLRKEAAARVAVAKLTPITVRAARQPTFSRLTFGLEQPVPVKLERSGNDVLVTFDAALKADLSLLKAELPPMIEGIDGTERDARLAINVAVAPGSDIRAFWDGTDYVVDVSGSRQAKGAAPAGADPAHPPAEPAGLEAALGGSRGVGEGVTTLSPETPAPATPAPETPAPAAPPPAAPAPAAVLPPAAEALPMAHPDAVLPKEAAAPAPMVPPLAEAAPLTIPAEGPADAPMKPVVTMAGQTVRIAFPFDRRTPGAVYRRGDNLWLVFDSGRRIDLDAILAGARDVVSDAALASADGAAVIRLKLRTTPLTTLSPDGLGWVVSIGDAILSGAAPVTMRRTVRADGRTAVSTKLEGVGSVHRITDTQVGDTVTVVTASAPARAFLKSQEFVEFRTLPTAHGLAFVASSDDIAVSIGVDDVTVSRDGGLTLSADTPAAEAAPVQRVALVNTAQWSRELEAPFQLRERELIQSAANSVDAERLAARIALARFYLAKDYATEAAAVLDVAGAADKNAGHNPEFGMLLAASRALMGRGAETNRILNDYGVMGTSDGSLWRSIAEASEHHFAAAREAFQKGANAIELYPKPLQARFRLAAFEAALELADMGDARAQSDALDALDVDLPRPMHRALLDARLSEGEGRKAEAIERYRRVVEGRDAIAAAEARLRAVTLRFATGQIDRKAVLDELETMAATWRGDEIEARTLRTLADENLQDGRDRAAFDNMKSALEYFPKSEATRALQDRMQERFIALFLDGAAEKLPPIDALALFYDYRELTPTDKRGDEMIRKLADRLVNVDLLDQAAELLQHQINNRLTGAGRSQVAAKLAMIYLMNRKPAQALQVLATTRQSNLPRELMTARLIIEARALSESARPELALEILDHLSGPDAAILKADVLWQARRWPEAGVAIETELGDSWQGADPLTDRQRADAMRAAIAFSLAEDKIGLDRLRTKFTEKMGNSADATSFEIVTAPIDVRGDKFSDIARQIAVADTLDAFLADYKARYVDRAPPAAAAPSAATDATASAG